MDPNDGSSFWDSLGSLFSQGDTSGVIKNTIQTLLGVQIPNLRSTLFSTLYGSLSGVIIAVTIIVTLIYISQFVIHFDPEHNNFWEGVRGSVIVFLSAVFLPGVATVLMWVSQYVAQSVSDWRGGSGLWAKPLNGVAPMTTGSGFGAAVLTIVFVIVKFFLWLLTEIMSFLIYIGIIGLLVSLVVIVFKRGTSKWGTRMLTFTLICITLRAILAIPLAVFGSFISGWNTSGDVKSIAAIFLLIGVCILPFWLMKKAHAKVQAFVQNKVLTHGKFNGKVAATPASGGRPAPARPGGRSSVNTPSRPQTTRAILRTGTSQAKQQLRQTYQATRANLAQHGRSRVKQLAAKVPIPQYQAARLGWNALKTVREARRTQKAQRLEARAPLPPTPRGR